MPIVPLPRITPTPEAPEPVLDHLRRPTIDRSPVVEGAAALAKAQEQPKVPMELAAPYSALGAIGRAISETGSVLGALAVKRQEALTSKQITDGDAAMRQHDLEEDNWRRENPDQTQWGAGGAERRQAFIKSTLSNPQLTPAARDALTTRMNRWDGMQGAQTQYLSDTKTFGEAKAGLDEAVHGGIQDQDMPRVNQAFVAGVKLGVYHPDDWARFHDLYAQEGERQTRKREIAAGETATNAALAFTEKNGLALAERNLDGGMFDPIGYTSTIEEREIQRHKMQDLARNREGTARETLVNGIASGELDTPKKIADAVKDAPFKQFVSPQMLESANKYLHDRKAEAEQADREANGPQNFAEMYQKVAAYDRSQFKTDEDAQLAAFNLRLEIRKKVGAQDDGWLAQKLWKKSNAGPPPPFQPSSPVQQLINDRMDRIFDPRTGLYKWQWPVGVRDASGRQLYDASGAKKIEWVPNEDNARENQVAHAKMRLELDQWMKQNPQKAQDPEEVSKAIGRFAPDGYLEKVKDEATSRFGALPLPGASPAAAPPQAGPAPRPTGSAAPQASTGPVPDDLVALMKKTEGFNPQAFGDYKQLSIGYGTRAHHADERISEPEADARLRSELAMHAGNIDTAAKAGGYHLTPSQRNALISFDFNTGHGAYLLNTAGGNLAEVKERLQKYTQAGGQVSPGLVNRRKMEAGLMNL